MAVFSGPEIVNDGLIFHYDMGNVQKSWKGKPTTNLLPQPLFFETGYTKESWTTGTVEDNSVIAPDGTLTATKIIRVSGYFYKRNVSSPTFTISPGQTVTFSSWVKKLDSTNQTGRGLYIWCYNGAGSGNRASASQEIFNDRWVKQSVTYTALTSETDFSFGFSGTASSHLQGAIAIWRPQIEISDFATPFVNGTRSNTEALIDIANNNTFTLTDISYNPDNTFEFDPVSNSVIFGPTQAAETNPSLSVFALCNPSAVNGSYGLWGYLDVNTNFNCHFETQAGSTWRVRLGTVNNSSAFAASTGWQYVGFTYDGSTVRFYINGELKSSWAGSSGQIFGNLSGDFQCVGDSHYFSGGERTWNGKIEIFQRYNRTLSTDEVKQNFEAIRGRYGL